MVTPAGREPPPRHFGDFPHGAYWSVDPPEGYEGDETLDFTVSGDVIEFAWDYGVVVPLWDGDGLVPDEPEWLERALGLSERLIADLSAWGNEMNDLDATRGTRRAYDRMDTRARALVDRLRAELGDRFRVVYRRW